ncbi:Von Willebrand factor type A domain protein [Enhygromyxa salina]|uniref:von Willebrand factor type A domain protein n=1 Tax=Enhygromyxa salina TaxID=215803 RepID=A0A0C1ZXS8_9BACT|nr:Von Willebrand factor type A domain protein [Enhygromyxa salina]
MAFAFGAVVTVATSGCSFAGDASLELAGDTGSNTTATGDGDGDDETSTDTGTSETGEPDTGEESSSTGPNASAEDPEFAADLCDPKASHAIHHNLEQAKVEATAVLVSDSVLAGDGSVPPIPLSARPFLNHFDFDYAPADGWDPQVSGELWQSPMINIDAPKRFRLQYAVRGPAMDPAERLTVDLAIVVDLGAAMAGDPLVLAEEALAALESSLLPGDRVTLIAAGETASVLTSGIVEGAGLMPLTGLVEQQDSLVQADIGAALELAYTSVTPAWDGQGQPRVLLISNGNFAGDDALTAHVGDQAVEGRYLITVGVGDAKQFDDMRISELAHAGRGAMLFAPTAEHLWVDLQEKFSANVVAAATELEVTVTLPPGLTMRQRSADPKLDAPDPELAILGPNDSLVFHHELEACAEVADDAVIHVEIEWIDPLAKQAKQLVWEQPINALGEASHAGQKGAATVAYARALRSFRDGGPPSETYGVVLDAISHISDALEAQPDDPDLIEMSSVVAALSQG